MLIIIIIIIIIITTVGHLKTANLQHKTRELRALYIKQVNNNENHKPKSHIVSQAAHNLHHTHTAQNQQKQLTEENAGHTE
jgi:hypothetical protein